MAAGTTSLNTPWARVANTTIADFIKGEQINILRNRKLPALLQRRGRISFNHSGKFMDHKVRYRRAPMIGYADGDTITFSRQDRNKTAQIDWRGYSSADAMYKQEFLMNRGAEAIIGIFDSRTRDLLEDVEDQLAEQMYIDGTLSANQKCIHGIESFLNYATQAVGNFAMLPSAVYGGLNCTPGSYGGSWSSSGALQWPNGKETDGTQSYDFWSPLIVDVGDTAWGSGTNLWGSSATAANNVCVEAVAYAIIKSKKSPSPKGRLDLFMLNDGAYQQYIKQLRGLQRIVVTGQIPELVGLGFDDVVQQDGGCDVTWEFGLPTSGQLNNGIGVIGYGVNLDQVELCSMQGQVWVPEGPSFDDASKAWRWSIDFFGNLKWNPKYQCKLLNYTTTSDSAQM